MCTEKNNDKNKTNLDLSPKRSLCKRLQIQNTSMGKRLTELAKPFDTLNCNHF